jgi:signal transduction histidine kinase
MPVSRVMQTPSLRVPAPAMVSEPAGRVQASGIDPYGVLSQPFVPIATAAAVAIMTLLAIQFGISSNGVVMLWPANAFAAAMWVRGGNGRVFDLCFGGLVCVGLLTGECLAGYGPTAALGLGAVNLLEVVMAVGLMRRFAPGQSLATIRSTAALLVMVAVVVPLIGAIAGAAMLAALKGMPVAEGFQIWWLGHALGMMLVVPLVLGINRQWLKAFANPLYALEWCVLLGVLGGLTYVRYFLDFAPVSFVLNMMLVLIAARLRLSGVMFAMLIVAIIMFEALVYGPYPIAKLGGDPTERLLSAQLLLLSITLPFMLVGTLLTERDGLSQRARIGQRRAELASESKSRLLANVAHEIKSPVAGVIGIGELWSSGQLGPVTSSQREMADILVKTARQVEALAHDLLDVARAESGSVKVELRPTDVVGVLEDVCRATALRPDAHGLKITVDCERVGLVAVADSLRLTQVVDNLATNAVKYGASGGSVTFRAMPVPAGIRIEVSDLGPGLTSQKQAQLFEPFNRLGLERSAVEGHGIGLALAKRLIELQGGSIGVDSEPGQGATFWVELPAA